MTIFYVFCEVKYIVKINFTFNLATNLFLNFIYMYITCIMFLLNKTVLDRESSSTTHRSAICVVNKVLLENMPICLHIVSGSFPATKAELILATETIWSVRLKYLPSGL